MDLKKELGNQLDWVSVEDAIDMPTIVVESDKLLELCRFLRDEWAFDLLLDVTAVDWGQEASPRFAGRYHLMSSSKHYYLRVKCDAVGDETPVLPSVARIWAAANWHERETYDMFGIKYEGHPDLRRILMWDEYPYFPLRKEFPLAGIETELPADDVVERTGVKVKLAPMMGGPFLAGQGGTMKTREPAGKDESWTEVNAKN